MKKLISFLLCLCLTAALLCGVLSVRAASDDIVILYTNDVHTYIANGSGEEPGLSYGHLAALKKAMLAETDRVLLVDMGDHIQGAAYGAMDQGLHIIEMMNAAGYDAATLGNHEFDYTVTGMFAAVGAADFPYLSCNFKDLTTGENVFDSYMIFDLGGTKVALVGITTPETFTSTAPAYFQDENGNFLYGIAGGEDGAALYAAVQAAIDAAKAEGADYIIGMGHLGVDESARPWTSYDVIANTEGLTALLDGHSHTVIASEVVTDKSGAAVLLSQTGSYFDNIGCLRISADGTVTAELIGEYTETDAEVAALVDSWIAEIDTLLGEKIADTLVDFAIHSEDGTRIVRSMETNLGNFNADAFYYVFNEVEGLHCDVAIVNGGGVRADVPAGDWSYMTAKTVNPFGNVLCLMEVTGQQLLDALEWGARLTTGLPDSPENGGFLHTSGLTYRIDATFPSTVQEEDGAWKGAPTGDYRVHDVKIYDRERGLYLPLDPAKTYIIGGANFTLRNAGDGFTMFKDAVLVKDYIMEDYLALATYAKAFGDDDYDGYAEISSTRSPLAAYDGFMICYENRTGSGRIAIVTQAAPETEPATEPITEPATEPVTDVLPADTEKITESSLPFGLSPLAVVGIVAAIVVLIAVIAVLVQKKRQQPLK